MVQVPPRDLRMIYRLVAISTIIPALLLLLLLLLLLAAAAAMGAS